MDRPNMTEDDEAAEAENARLAQIRADHRRFYLKAVRVMRDEARHCYGEDGISVSELADVEAFAARFLPGDLVQAVSPAAPEDRT